MKKLLFLVLLSSSSFLVKAQEYTPLLDNLNEWHFTSCFSGCLTDVYYTNGDTVVAGENYKVLDGYHYISRTFLLREDIAQKKVYLKLLLSSGERNYLLYDFSLNVGDTIAMKNPITPFPENAGYYLLDSIVNRPLADGNLYKHFYFSPTPSNTLSTNNAIWIEGVGSLSLINAPSGKPDINDAGHLSCFFKNGELFYSNLESISGCEPLILSNNLEQNTLETLKVLKMSEYGQYQMILTESVRYVDIFDLTGKKITSIQNDAKPQINFNLSTFKSGLYIMVAYSEKFERKTFKIAVN